MGKFGLDQTKMEHLMEFSHEEPNAIGHSTPPTLLVLFCMLTAHSIIFQEGYLQTYLHLG